VTEFGRYSRTLPPGRHTFNIFSEKVIQISMRTVCLDVPAQTLMTQDNLALTIDAVCFYNVFDARLAAFEVQSYQHATSMLAQVTIRSVLGEMDLKEILAGRHIINSRLRKIIDERTDPWGIKVDRVELKEIKITDQMQRAMAAKAEADQEAEAKLVQARAQREASAILKDAAKELSEEPNAMKLHWFETLRIISTQGRNTTIIVPDNIEPASALAVRK
jgi:regulator of protease activity HflC (stomatin/prohibitin superfamily)